MFRRLSQSHRFWIPSVALAGSLLVTGLAAFATWRSSLDQERLQFENAVQRTEDDIQQRLDTYIALLKAGSGFFAASDRVSRADFRAYIAQQHISQAFPGIQGIGYSLRFSANQKSQVLRSLQQQGIANFQLKPNTARSQYHAIIYLEPLDRRNQAAIGYDMFIEPTRRAAMQRARDTGLPAASGPVTLVQEIDPRKQTGFLIYLPIYRQGAPTETIEQRRAALTGFIYSPFRVGDLMAGILQDKVRYVDFQLYDGTPTADHLMHRSQELQNRASGKWTQTISLDVAGRPWTLVFTSRPELAAASGRSLIPYIITTGIVIGLILFGLTRSQTQALTQLEQTTRERANLLTQLQQQTKELQETSRLKDEFLATLSHELRTPMNAIMGWITLLQTRKFDSATVARAMETIDRNTKALNQLIEDILDVSRIINGKLHLKLHPIELVPLVEATIEMVQASADAKQIQIQAVLEPATPTILGDSTRVQQILWNLLSNAIKFTPVNGKVTVKLTQQQRDQNSIVQIQVIDSGQGISAEFLPHVFDRFRQADGRTTRAHGGLGLGLAIVYHLVELHGGTIRAESEGLGKGATFTVEFPVWQRPQKRPSTQTSSNFSPLRVENSLDGICILVVDDDIDSCEVVAATLREFGANVIIATAADQALARLAQIKPHILISDIGMPDTDGYELMRQVRTLQDAQIRNIPAIALTAYAAADDRTQAFASGFQAHLAKPIQSTELVQTVATLAFQMHSKP